jgi:hypothetical protein
MSFLTGQTANADLVAAEKTPLVTWPRSELRGFFGRDAEVRAVVQMAIGEDLVAKLRAGRRVPDWSRAVLHLVDARREMPTFGCVGRDGLCRAR